MATEGTRNGRLHRGFRRARAWIKLNVPPGLRLVIGLIFVVGGIFGFLPILGFWMIPLGISIAALDVRPLWFRFQAWKDSD